MQNPNRTCDQGFENKFIGIKNCKKRFFCLPYLIIFIFALIVDKGKLKTEAMKKITDK